MAHLRLTARVRTEPLSDAETVRLGRLLTHRLGLTHVAFPNDSATPVVLVRDCEGGPAGVPTSVVSDIVAVIGEFDIVTFDRWDGDV